MKFEIGDLVKLSGKSGDQNVRGIITKIQKGLHESGTKPHYLVNWIWLDNNSHFWYASTELEKV
jgi:hypothetical protein